MVAGLGQAVGAHVAEGDRPFVGLLGEEGADEADHGGPVGEDAHDVGAPADLLVEAFLGVVGTDLGPVLDGEGANAKMSSAASSTSVARSQNPAWVRRSTTSPSWDQVASRSGCSKIERTRVAIIGQFAFGTLVARLAMKWV